MRPYHKSHPGVGTGIPIPWDPSLNPKFLRLGLGSIFQNFEIGIGFAIDFSECLGFARIFGIRIEF